MSTGQPIRVRAAMKPFSTVPSRSRPWTSRPGAGGRDQAAHGRLRRAGRRGRRRGGRRVRAGRRDPGEVRGRLARRRRAEPGPPTWRPAVIVYLVGMPGPASRPSARELAGRLGVPFVDLDVEIERRDGSSVARDLRDGGRGRRSARWRPRRSRRRDARPRGGRVRRRGGARAGEPRSRCATPARACSSTCRSTVLADAGPARRRAGR